MIFDTLLGIIDTLLGAHLLGYTIVFLAAFLESFFAVGTFVPGQTIVILAGVAARRDLNHLTGFFLMASLGSVLGGLLSYEFGRRYGLRIVPRYVKNRIKDTEGFFRKYSTLSLIIGRFNSILRSAVPFIAGIHKMEFKKFISVEIIGGMMWSFLFLSLGFFFGLWIKRIERYFGIASIIVLVILIGALYLFERFARKEM